MTTLGSPGSSSQSVLGFSGQKEPEKHETDWDDNPGKPRLVIPVRFGVFWPKNAKNTDTDWDDNPGQPRLVIPVRCGLFWPGNPETDWDDKPRLPKVVINPETDWDDKSGLPRLVIPVRFVFFGPFRPENPKTNSWASWGKFKLFQHKARCGTIAVAILRSFWIPS